MLEARGMDLLLVSCEENNRYFAGAKSLVTWRSFTRPVFVIADGKKPPIIVIHESLADAAKSEGYCCDIRTYASITEPPVRQLSKILKETLPSGGRVGFEGGYEQRIGLPFSDMTALVSSAPHIHFVDASSIIWNLRMKKSAREVDCMKNAGRILAKARPHAVSRMRSGMTEREAARIVGATILEFGADEVAFVHVNTGQPHTWYPTDRKLSPGDLVYIDAGATVKGYTCEYDRLATVGRPTKVQRALHESVCHVVDGMRSFMKANTKCSEVYAECDRLYSQQGRRTAKWGRAGHGQGLLATEPPSIAFHDTTVLLPGMTVSNEPGFICGEGVFVWEDVYAITSEGNTTLSIEPRELMQIS